jgi:xanthine dehydrogenase YagT iron-sulfur-binding subunit
MTAKKEDPSDAGFSRRGFLKGVGAGALAAGVLPGTTVPAQAATSTADAVGPDAVPITLEINGQTRKLSVEPRVTLLDALRNHLELTGAKKVCDRATCGACTVLLEGKAVYACTVLAISAQGKKVETIESLAQGDELAPIQTHFVANDGQQCGFCTPGFVMACESYLRGKPNPTRQDVLDHLGGNLCRCGTYAGVTEAVLDTAKGVR